ncbi:Beige protein-like 1 [Sporothrix bragantina]|uniref:Beige protein-like 1 n=1 Tax=Sporothrix bragantina TaxID=671064 RepID=A0ABP0CBM2_9PEZI
MATRPSRNRSSTSASNQLTTSKAAEVLQSLLHGMQAVISPPSSSPARQQLLPTDQQSSTPPRQQTVGGYPDIQALLKYARQIHQYLTAHPPPSTAQDDFRHMHGF